jgi:hypothetical protein
MLATQPEQPGKSFTGAQGLYIQAEPLFPRALRDPKKGSLGPEHPL